MDFEKINVNDKLKLFVCETSNNYGLYELINLKRGFGTTIGNSLRRVLLSSIEGTALTVVKKIELNDEAILHEFTALDGVRESVPEIIFNLKKVIFQIDRDIISSGTAIIEINFSNEGNCLAKDIKLPTGVKVLNPDEYIFQLADGSKKLYMQLQIELGSGYVSSEYNKYKNCSDRKDAYTLNTVYVDSDFSPVKKVSFDTIETIVNGEVFDKLKLEIYTDGSIDPTDALRQASYILISDYAIFLNRENFIIEKAEVKDIIQIEEHKDENQGDIYLKDLEISVRSKNCLENTPIKTLKDLASYSAQELLEIKNFGQKSLVEVRHLLQEYGFKLKGE
jgi:DNA-directed RNA polymerase subunit alpha